MDQLHFHLIVNHLPIIGTLLGILVLIYAILVKSVHTKIAAYSLFIISSLGAAAAYLTGEGAEDAVEGLQGITESVIERHEDFSVYALTALIILGVASIAGIIAAQKKLRWSKMISSGILALSIIGLGLIVWTGYLGGQIRHTEINSPAVNTQAHDQQEHDDEAVAAEVKLNNGEKWRADITTNQGIDDLFALINSSENEKVSRLKDTLMGRVNQIIEECTMPPKADEQLHNYLLPLIDKINGLEKIPSDSQDHNKQQEILTYLKTYRDYFK